MAMTPETRKRIIPAIAAAVIVLLIGIVRVSQNNKVNENPLPPLTNTNSTATGFVFRSVESEGFTATFPAQPSRSSETVQDPKFGTYTYTTYQSGTDHSVYFVAVYDYTSSSIIDDPNFDVNGGLEGAVNGMVNAVPGAKILSATKTTFQGKQALQFQTDLQGERMDGVVVFSNGHMYLIALDYDPNYNIQSELAAFLQSFSFNK